MSADARFEDGRDGPLNLGAFEVEDLGVISALVQDAVFPATEMRFVKGERRFALLLNRFRWENGAQMQAERVQSVLAFDNVRTVASQGVSRADKDMVLSLLSVEFIPGQAAPGGQVLLTLAGDGAIRLQVEALEAVLRDVTRPYRAPSGKVPDHGA